MQVEITTKNGRVVSVATGDTVIEQVDKVELKVFPDGKQYLFVDSKQVAYFQPNIFVESDGNNPIMFTYRQVDAD
jgi:hypothetical protein